jgi:DNA polymerase-3 subunit epsilon
MFRTLFNYWQKRNLTDKNFEFLFNKNFSPEDEYIVFDTETTGLNTKKDEIISIGAVKVKNNKILLKDKFLLYLQPKNMPTEETIKIHKIRVCDLENNTSSQEKGIKDFLEFIGSRPVVGYYLEFDVAMLNKYLKKILNISLPNKQIEVSALYFDKKIKETPNGNIDLRFDVIMQRLNLPVFGKHDALNDAIMTAMMFLKLK